MNRKLLLADDVKQIIIETDEDEPVILATIGDTVETAEGYRVHVIIED